MSDRNPKTPLHRVHPFFLVLISILVLLQLDFVGAGIHHGTPLFPFFPRDKGIMAGFGEFLFLQIFSFFAGLILLLYIRYTSSMHVTSRPVLVLAGCFLFFVPVGIIGMLLAPQ